MVKKSLSLLAFWVATTTVFVFDISVGGSRLPLSIDSTEEILEADLKKKLTENVHNFCEDTTWLNLKYNPSLAVKEKFNSSIITELKDRATDVDSYFLEKVLPWELTRVPNIKIRSFPLSGGWVGFKQNCSIYLDCPMNAVKSFLKNEYNPFLEEAFKSAIPYPTYSADFLLKQQSQASLTYKNFRENLNGYVERAAFYKFCSDVTLLHVDGCVTSLLNQLKFSTPISDIVAIPLVTRFLSNEKYIEGAVLAAIKILGYYQTGKIPTKANLFNDLVDSYQDTGMLRPEAEDFAWDTLAVISTGGPNTGLRMRIIQSEAKFNRLKLAVSSIALMIPKLDLLSAKSGYLYSMPDGISTTCEIGKPYHFWMTAYLARREVRNGATTTAAAASAYLLQKGYEMLSTTKGRDPARAFFTSSFGSWNNMMRIDTAFSSAAAIYGANAAKGIISELNIDEGLKTIIMAGKVFPTLTDSKAKDLWKDSGFKGYSRWNSMISSDAGFNFYFEKIK